MNLIVDVEDFRSELNNVIRMFFPFFKGELDASIAKVKGKIVCKIAKRTYRFGFKEGEIGLKEYKIALYRGLSKYFGKKLPWGSLTGIRPTRIVYKQISEGEALQNAIKTLKKTYLVSAKKADLVEKIIAGQEGFLYNHSEFVNLYVHIPFCPSRCSYCSFISQDINKSAELVEPYLDRLAEEISQIKPLIGKKILSVYIGGGTPTALNIEQLYRLLSVLSTLDFKCEFTVEAGRPDTIDVEKLAVLKRFGATRISINPQTFNDKTLQNIGRNHTTADIFSTMELAKKFDFDINMDLIAGLIGETTADFAHSIRNAIELEPDNITVHTLSIKNGSQYFNNKPEFNTFTEKMVDFALKTLDKAGFSPYYLYRQKNMTDNLENVGYSLKGKQNIFNVTSMEETVSVLALGAGAITKLIGDNSIERFANLRDIKLYNQNFEDMMAKKIDFVKKYHY